MQVRTGQDFAAGVMFALVGIGALWIGADYPMGTTQRPGTGVLPAILAWCLIGTGGILTIKAMVAGDIPVGRWAWRPLLAVTLATISFGLLVDSAGLVIAMAVSLTLCAAGTPETRWMEYAAFLLIMLAIGVGTFVWLLGMPIPIWPIRWPDWLAFLGR
ncbi:MAG: tripartite tricarboxylate transporter TctB family protein [Hyphomicrobiaceae bacterium]